MGKRIIQQRRGRGTSTYRAHSFRSAGKSSYNTYNKDAVISGNIIPTQDLSNFYGENSSGNWTLKVVDSGEQDNGTIESWSVELCTSEPILGTGGEELTNFNVYPNPAGDYIQIEFYSYGAGKTNITMYDLLGREVLKEQFDSGDHHFKKRLYLGRVSSGFYYLKVKNGAQISVKKLLIK